MKLLNFAHARGSANSGPTFPLSGAPSRELPFGGKRTRVCWLAGARQSATLDQGFGMRIVLIIKVPETANISTGGWNCQGPAIAMPPHSWSPSRSCQAASARTKTSSSEVGIGVPS